MVNIISKLLAITMLLLVPICIVGMLFNLSLFGKILVFDLLAMIMLLVFTEQVRTTTLQKIGYAFIGVFYFLGIILNVIMLDTIFLTIAQVFVLFFEAIGLALVIGGKGVKENDKD